MMKEKNNAPWWNKDWFWDAYRPLMFDPDRMADTPGEVDKLVKLTGLKPGDTFLDSCCGFGRHSLELARRGFAVTGVDRQESYIREAQKTAAKENLDAEFVLEESRSFCRPESFHGAMNFFSSFGYFDEPDEEEAAVKNIFASLRPGGFFLIDIQGKELLARDFKRREWFERDGFRIFLEYRILDAWTRLENRWLFSPLAGPEKDNVTETVFSHRIYSALELAELLTRCGFESVELYGGLDGQIYDEKAQRLTAVARKAD